MEIEEMRYQEKLAQGSLKSVTTVDCIPDLILYAIDGCYLLYVWSQTQKDKEYPLFGREIDISKDQWLDSWPKDYISKPITHNASYRQRKDIGVDHLKWMQKFNRNHIVNTQPLMGGSSRYVHYLNVGNTSSDMVDKLIDTWRKGLEDERK